MSDDIDNRLIDYDDNYEGEPRNTIWAMGSAGVYHADYLDNGDVLAIVIVPTSDGE